jgi:hypothetical protein
MGQPHDSAPRYPPKKPRYVMPGVACEVLCSGLSGGTIHSTVQRVRRGLGSRTLGGRRKRRPPWCIAITHDTHRVRYRRRHGYPSRGIRRYLRLHKQRDPHSPARLPTRRDGYPHMVQVGCTPDGRVAQDDPDGRDVADGRDGKFEAGAYKTGS